MLTAVTPLAECLSEAIAFRNANRSLARDESYFAWRYLERPSGPAFLVQMRDGAELVAAATVVPHEYCIAGRRYTVGMVGDISVARLARGRGLARPLLAAVVEHSAPLDGVIVMPNPPVVAALRDSEWRQIASIGRRVRVFNAPGASLPKRLVVACVARTLSVGLRSQARRIDHEICLERCATLDARWDAIWERAAGAGAFMATRDRRYLEWRYSKHPLERYEILVLTSGSRLLGYAMCRREGDLVWIDDWHAVDARSSHALGVRLVEYWAREGVASIHMRAVETAIQQVPWSRLGFFRRPDTQLVFAAGAWLPAALAGMEASFFTAGDKDV